MADDNMSIKDLAASNPTPQQAMAYGMNLGKTIDWRNLMVWITCIAMVILIVYLIVNIQYVRIDLNPLQYCAKLLNASDCYCQGKVVLSTLP